MANAQLKSEMEQTVYVVDDDTALRDSLSVLLGLNGYRVELFSCGEDFLAAYEKAFSGCLLLDVRMAAMSGIQLQAELRGHNSTLPVIVMTAFADIRLVRKVLKDGAIDFLEKPVDPDMLLEAVRTAFHRDAAVWAAASQATLAQQQLARLTARERQVLELVSKGYHNREIAEELAISPRTVEVHKGRVMEKLNARSVSTLVRLVLAAALEPSSVRT